MCPVLSRSNCVVFYETDDAGAKMELVGVNLSGAEYGGVGMNRPDWDYHVPTSDDIDYFASRGMNVIRLPIQWERLQPSQDGALAQGYLSEIDAVVDHAASRNMKVIIDPHNYGSGYGALVGSSATPTASLADFWQKVATHFKDDQNVIFGLMNEPNQQKAADWAATDQALINAIRSTGAQGEILAPGTGYTSATIWAQSGNETPLAALTDPAHNTAIETHVYLDQDSSGTHYDPVTDPDIGVSRLGEITGWARTNGLKLFLGEIGAPGDSASLRALDTTMAYMQANPGIWQGETYWAGGDWWGSYPFSVQPDGKPGSYVDKPQMAVLERYAAMAAVADLAHPVSSQSIPETQPNDGTEKNAMTSTIPEIQDLSPQRIATTLAGFPIPPLASASDTQATEILSPIYDSATANAPDGTMAYRFFDSVHGSQFLTSSLGEVQDIIRNRPDLVLEGRAFATATSDDKAAAPVFRFFDTVLGNHFFTADAGEAQTAKVTRPDLTYEGVGFYEHMVKQAADVEVHRFFNTGDGSHLYTENAQEVASISLLRPDLKDEGISFYAPQAR